MNDKPTTTPIFVEIDLLDTSELDFLAHRGMTLSRYTDTTTTSDTIDLLGDEFLPARDEGSLVNIEEDPFVGLSIHTEVDDGRAQIQY